MTPTETQMSTIERHNLLRCLIAGGIYSLCLVHHRPCKNKNDRKKERLDLAPSCRSQRKKATNTRRLPRAKHVKKLSLWRATKEIPINSSQLLRAQQKGMVVCVRVCVWVSEGVGVSVLNFPKSWTLWLPCCKETVGRCFFLGGEGGGVDGRVSESAPSSVISLALCEESAMSKNQGPFCNSERQSIVFEMPYVSETQLSVCFERL